MGNQRSVREPGAVLCAETWAGEGVGGKEGESVGWGDRVGTSVGGNRGEDGEYDIECDGGRGVWRGGRREYVRGNGNGDGGFGGEGTSGGFRSYGPPLLKEPEHHE